jgi:hypothetical protein
LLLTLGRALAYATPHSPWTPVERAGTSDAPCSQGKGLCGAMLDASGGRAGTVVVARQAEGPAGSVQGCPDVPAVDGGTKEREEGRDGGVWSEGLGARARRCRAGKAGPSSVVRDGGAIKNDVQRYTRGVPGEFARASSTLYKYALYRK